MHHGIVPPSFFYMKSAFVPITIKTMPPTMVALLPSIAPKRRPISSATTQQIAVVKQIAREANITLTERAAKLTPTASASMLVAMA